ncbi:hypothetical protein IM792_17320 [Mucilaginibacter sp. JRF]|uniref:hypothetical protein n=1 Tax=Mucilaginibacter sp. JRF TaxID=2780088 RepID=UPI00188254AB|nr:hypothetical protein [Mucilaginibacter sp. JRF]MBE9586219.1 hypothetical protein [Mucilaginibacter sp. JRF]
MQGISDTRHRQLVDALLQLENLLCENLDRDSDMQTAGELRAQLETTHANYNKQIVVLSELIQDYHNLFNKIKLQFIAPKLKELRKKAHKRDRIYPSLVQNIQHVYGT